MNTADAPIAVNHSAAILQAELRRLLFENDGLDVNQALSLGAKLHQMSCREAALAAVESAAEYCSDNISIWHAVAGLRLELDLPYAALEACNAALRLNAEDADSLFNTAVVLESLGDFGASLHCYEKALVIAPDHARTLLNFGPLLGKMGRIAEAVLACERAVDLLPLSADCHFNLGDALLGASNHAEALAEFNRAIELHPGFARAEMAAAVATAALGDVPQAASRMRLATAMQPSIMAEFRSPLATDNGMANPELTPERIAILAAYDRMLSGDLKAHEAFVALFNCLLNDDSHGLRLDHPNFPYLTLGLPIPEEARRRVARVVSARHARTNDGVRLAKRRRPRAGRLRLGYISGDFRAHAVAWVIGGLFGRHDRKRFEVFVYSTGPDDGGPERQNAVAGADVFRDVANFSGVVVAQAIAMDGVDVLIDLSGHTKYSMGEALALRPAPIQVSYLGFMGTQGAPFIDYSLLDRTVMLPDVAQWWDEKIVYLPYCFSPCEKLQSAFVLPSRSALGLPEDVLVIGALHAHRKIDPETFRLWMCILRRTSRTVLWLMAGAPGSEASLKSAAEQSGVAPDRLIFSPECSHDEYLARCRLVDFAVDAILYNGHTTSIDLLSMGVPFITKPGRDPVARVGASLLGAHAFPELVAETEENFVSLAVRLASDDSWRFSLREKLSQHTDSKLFCPERHARELEKAYELMWARHTAGLPPADFDVPPLDA